MKNSFEISELIGYVLEEFPARFDLVTAFQNCDVSKGNWKGDDYFRFVDNLNANEPGAQWQFTGNFVLQGRIIVDYLKSGIVCGIEFLPRGMDLRAIQEINIDA